MLIIMSDGTTLETEADAQFHYAPASADGDGYVELHIDLDFGVLGQTLTMSLPSPAIAELCQRLRTRRSTRKRGNLRIIDL